MFGIDDLAAATIIGSVIAGGVALYNGINSKITSNKNLSMQKKQLNYQKYLNNNQIQMQVADAQKAGINPIAMQGGSLSSGSYSNVDAPSVDASGVLSVINSYMDNRTNKSISDATNETTKAVNKDTLDANSGIRSAEEEKLRAEALEIQQRTSHEKDMHEQELAQQEIQTEILRRKNEGQINTGTFDGQPTITYTDNGRIKLGPVSFGKTSSSTVPYGSNLANAGSKNLKGFNDWLSKNIPEGATPIKETPFYLVDDKHIGERLSDGGYKQIGKYDRYVVFYNKSANKYAVVDNGSH